MMTPPTANEETNESVAMSVGEEAPIDYGAQRYLFWSNTFSSPRCVYVSEG